MKLKLGASLAIISFFVFIFVNILENLLYYNIGYNAKENTESESDRDRKSENENESNRNNREKFNLPDTNDWIKILVIMLIFAAIQGVLTMFIFDYDVEYMSNGVY